MAARLEAYNGSEQQQAIGDKLHHVNLLKSLAQIPPDTEIDFAKRVQEMQKVSAIN